MFDIYKKGDPWEDMKGEDFPIKFICFLLHILFLISPFWFLSVIGLLGGAVVTTFQIYAACRLEKNYSRKIILRELISGWRSGELTSLILVLSWVGFLAILMQLLIYQNLRIVTFSDSYKHMKFNAYQSGGKYYGMHVETANQWSNKDIELATEKADSLDSSFEKCTEAAKKKSRLAILYTTLISILSIPFSWVKKSITQDGRAYISQVQLIYNAEVFQTVNALAQNVFEIFKRLLRRLANMFHKIIYETFNDWPRFILWLIYPQPIRAIPFGLSSSFSINSPPYFGFDFKLKSNQKFWRKNEKIIFLFVNFSRVLDRPSTT